MCAQRSNTKSSQPTVKISDVLFLTLRHWVWLLISIVGCVGLAVLYVLKTPPVYTRSAEIIIKDDSKSSASSPEMEAFSDISMMKLHSNMEDEINKLQSPDFMSEVVKNLNLNVSLYSHGKFHDELLYGTNAPINVLFPSTPESIVANGRLTILSDDTYKFEELISSENSILPSLDTEYCFGDTVKTSIGPIIVDKSSYFHFVEPMEIMIDRTSLSSAVNKFMGELSIERKSSTGNTINIIVSDNSIQRADDIINTLIGVYNARWIENRNQISVSTSNFITERLAVIENELGNVDQDISSYQSEHLIPDVQQAANMYMSENQAASAKILELNNQLQLTRYMRNYLINEANNAQVLPFSSGVQNAGLESQIASYNEKMLQRNRYAANSSETHPMVVDLDAQLAAQRYTIIASVDNIITALNTQIKNLQTSKNETTAQIAANPSQAKYLLSVERQQKVKESLYLFLLQKREENELSQAFTAYNTQIISLPHGSNLPTAPLKKKIIFTAFLLGLFLPVGVNFAIAALNTKVRGKQDLNNLTIPFMAEIPDYKPKKKIKGDKTGLLVVKQGKRDIINEAFRILRTNIRFVSANSDQGTVIMITSFNAGSGKTFITMNLAYSLALNGKKVVVIDGDMRRASASVYVDSPKKGISDYLAGRLPRWEDAIVSDTLVEGLSVIPVGTIPPNPTELLETQAFTNLITTLKKQFDYVLIDCPPSEMMADAHIIEQISDRTLFIIRTGIFELSLLPELEKSFQAKKFKNMGIVLNGTEVQNSRYGYKYGYGYGYGYGYSSYGQDDQN